MLQLGPPAARLKTHIQRLSETRGIAVGEDGVFLTTGAQQALDLVCRLLLSPGDLVYADRFTYPGMAAAVRSAGAVIRAFPTRADGGLDFAALRGACIERKPVFFYVMPSAHNPLGISMLAGERAGLLSVAREFGIYVVEDDAYGLLSFEDPAPPAMAAGNQDTVIHINSFSKILGPSLRTGWMICPEPLRPYLTNAKNVADLSAASLSQWLILAYLDEGWFAAHAARTRSAYRRRCETMAAAIAESLPGASSLNPSGGMFLWTQLSGGVDTNALLESAARHGVMYAPGSIFALDGCGGADCMRLNFTHCAEEEIRPAIARLGLACAEYRRQARLTENSHAHPALV